MRRLLPISFALISCACTMSSEKQEQGQWLGNWTARWETSADTYPDENMKFFMDGNFTFTKDNLTVKANGFEGCIFGVDTLIHTQSWYVSSDSLYLFNDPGSVGIIYKITSRSDRKIELQLMEDIFITLKK